MREGCRGIAIRGREAILTLGLVARRSWCVARVRIIAKPAAATATRILIRVLRAHTRARVNSPRWPKAVRHLTCHRCPCTRHRRRHARCPQRRHVCCLLGSGRPSSATRRHRHRRSSVNRRHLHHRRRHCKRCRTQNRLRARTGSSRRFRGVRGTAFTLTIAPTAADAAHWPSLLALFSPANCRVESERGGTV